MDTNAINRRADLIASRQHSAEQAAADRAFQANADAAFATLGLGEAPRRGHSEPVHAHRARVADAALGAVAGLDHASRKWQGFDPRGVRDDGAATQIAQTVLDEAVQTWTAPVGELRESVTRDPSGREVHKFYGDPEDCWGRFKRAPSLVTKWTTPRGAEAAGATPGYMLPDGRFVRR